MLVVKWVTEYIIHSSSNWLPYLEKSDFLNRFLKRIGMIISRDEHCNIDSLTERFLKYVFKEVILFKRNSWSTILKTQHFISESDSKRKRSTLNVTVYRSGITTLFGNMKVESKPSKQFSQLETSNYCKSWAKSARACRGVHITRPKAQPFINTYTYTCQPNSINKSYIAAAAAAAASRVECIVCLSSHPARKSAHTHTHIHSHA